MDETGHRAPSPRVALAALARDSALTTPGVVALDSGTGGLFMTVGGGERVPGVSCVAAPGGGYDVSMRLVCELVPLQALADWVRREVAEAAARADLALASVTITVADVVDPEET